MSLSSILMTAGISLAVTALLGFIVIPVLHKMKYGQTILDIGPKWHEKKQGTATMGGIMFIIGFVVAVAAGFILLASEGKLSFDIVGSLESVKALSCVIMALLFGFVGFLDDFIKVKKKRNEGLTEKQKLILQFLIVAAYFTTRILMGDTSTVIRLPFIGAVDLWYFYYVVVGLGMIYIVNAVNLTDGIDGLCSSVSFIYFITFAIICSMFSFNTMTLVCIAAAASMLGFLWWNFPPAKVFMGDTGSLFLGGLVVGIGVGTGMEVLMVIAAAVFIWEALTVLIQQTYFKLTHGKRLFKMTPIHHAFEIRGWKEIKIDFVFSLLALVAGGVSVLLSTAMF